MVEVCWTSSQCAAPLLPEVELTMSDLVQNSERLAVELALSVFHNKTPSSVIIHCALRPIKANLKDANTLSGPVNSTKYDAARRLSFFVLDSQKLRILICSGIRMTWDGLCHSHICQRYYVFGSIYVVKPHQLKTFTWLQTSNLFT